MKLLSIVVATALAQREDKKVPPRHPLQRLARLVEFSHEMLDEWFTFLPSKDAWKAKFESNAVRMERNFNRGSQRCGFYDDGQLPHGGPAARKRRSDEDDSDYFDYDGDDELRYNRDDPSVGAKQLTTGFRKWAQRFLSACSGQRNYSYQVNRMNKWNGQLQDHLQSQSP